jgi:hypothetical protein
MIVRWMSTSEQTPAYCNNFPTNAKNHQHPSSPNITVFTLSPTSSPGTSAMKRLYRRFLLPKRQPTSRRRNTLVRQARIPSCQRDASPTEKREEQAEQPCRFRPSGFAYETCSSEAAKGEKVESTCVRIVGYVCSPRVRPMTLWGLWSGVEIRSRESRPF